MADTQLSTSAANDNILVTSSDKPKLRTFAEQHEIDLANEKAKEEQMQKERLERDEREQSKWAEVTEFQHLFTRKEFVPNISIALRTRRSIEGVLADNTKLATFMVFFSNTSEFLSNTANIMHILTWRVSSCSNVVVTNVQNVLVNLLEMAQVKLDEKQDAGGFLLWVLGMAPEMPKQEDLPMYIAPFLTTAGKCFFFRICFSWATS